MAVYGGLSWTTMRDSLRTDAGKTFLSDLVPSTADARTRSPGRPRHGNPSLEQKSQKQSLAVSANKAPRPPHSAMSPTPSRANCSRRPPPGAARRPTTAPRRLLVSVLARPAADLASPVAQPSGPSWTRLAGSVDAHPFPSVVLVNRPPARLVVLLLQHRHRPWGVVRWGGEGGTAELDLSARLWRVEEEAENFRARLL